MGEHNQGYNPRVTSLSCSELTLRNMIFKISYLKTFNEHLQLQVALLLAAAAVASAQYGHHYPAHGYGHGYEGHHDDY
ncbi:hypothetical protein TNCV_349341, partial [Trichonephila clavipes]